MVVYVVCVFKSLEPFFAKVLKLTTIEIRKGPLEEAKLASVPVLSPALKG